MSKTLNRADAEAVDVLLGDGLVHGQAPVGLAGGTVANEHLHAVKLLLIALAKSSTPEPSPDLVERTLRRIAGDSFSASVMAATAADRASSQQLGSGGSAK